MNAPTDVGTSDAKMRPPAAIRAFNALVSAMNSLGTLGIIILMLLICGDVFMRTVLSRPVAGIPELVRVFIVIVVFLQVSHTLAVGRFTVSEVFLDVIDARAPRVGHLVRGVYAVLGALLFACVTIGCFDQFIRNWDGADYIGSPGIFTVPLWPMKAVVAFGSGVLTIQFIINAIRHFKGQQITFDEVENEVRNTASEQK